MTDESHEDDITFAQETEDDDIFDYDLADSEGQGEKEESAGTFEEEVESKDDKEADRDGDEGFWDDLASTGSPTLDVGFLAINSDTTTDDDALLADLDVTAAASTAVSLIDDFADWGKEVWELDGLSADPKSQVWITATIKDAACNTGGTIAMSIFWSVD